MLTLLLLFIIRSTLCIDPITLDLLTPKKEFGDACGYDSCGFVKEGMLNVHIVPHTHAELGLGRTFIEHYTGVEPNLTKSDVNMKRILDYTISQLWANPQRRFAFADFPYFFHWWSRRDETVRRMVYQLLRQGRLVFIGGGWGMPDEATTSYHAIIDLFTYSLRKINATFLECGRPLVAWQSDVLGHSREFASLMAQMGFDAFFFNPMSFDDELFRMQRKGLEFLWRGSDDLGAETDIFSHKLFDGYWSPPGFCFSSTCTDPLLVASDTLFKNVDERAKLFIQSMQYRQSPGYGTQHVMVMMGKLFGYYDAELWFANIDRLIAAVNDISYKQEFKMHLMYSTPNCYVKAVYGETPALETKQDDFYPLAYNHVTYMTGFYTSFPSLKLLAREGNVFLQMAKQLQVLARLYNNDKKFEEIQWINAVFQDHTIITGQMKDRVRKHYIKMMYEGIQKSTLILKQAFNKLRNSPKGTNYYRCEFNVSSCLNTEAHSQSFIVIYNPLAWPVSIPVRIPISSTEFQVTNFEGLKENATLMKIPYPVFRTHIKSTRDTLYEIVFIAKDLPPLGFRSYFIEQTLLNRKKKDIHKKNKDNHRTNMDIHKRNTDIHGRNTDIHSRNTNIHERNTNIHRSKRDNQRREIIKKLNKKKNKTYIIRQTRIEDDGLLPDLDIEEDEFFDDTTTTEDPNIKNLLNLPVQVNYDKLKELNITDLEEGRRSFSEIKGKDKFLNFDPSDRRKWISLDETSTTQTTDDLIQLYDDTTQNIYQHKDLLENNYKNRTDIDEEFSKIIDDTIIPKLDLNMTKIPKKKVETNYVPIPGKVKTVKGETATVKKEKIAKTKNIEPEKRTRIVHGESTTRKVRKTVKAITKRPVTTTQRRRPTQPRVRPTTHYKPNVGRKSSVRKDNQLEESKDLFIENQYIRIGLDSDRRVKSLSLSNGISIQLDIQIYYYASALPEPWNEDNLDLKDPGAWVFRSSSPTPFPILDYLDVQVYKTSIVQELHCIYGDYASFVMRLYDGSATVELDWLVGPVAFDDGVGKEVFIRYKTNLDNYGVFYTDANGRQTMKRIRNSRPLYKPVNKDEVAGNMYPVTSKIYIEDEKKNIRFSVFNDRSQAGTSLYDGEIDLFLSRTVLTSDYKIQVIQNETENGRPVTLRGKHYLYVSKADYKPNKIFEKKFAKEIELSPQVLVSSGNPYGIYSKTEWLKHINEIGFVNKELPIGIHILTLQEWNYNTLLLRLENYLEKSDVIQSGIKTVFLKNIFSNIVINQVKETTLGANMWLKEFTPLSWKKKQKFYKNFNLFYRNATDIEYDEKDSLKAVEDLDVNRGIWLAPQQIRTFVCHFQYK